MHHLAVPAILDSHDTSVGSPSMISLERICDSGPVVSGHTEVARKGKLNHLYGRKNDRWKWHHEKSWCDWKKSQFKSHKAPQIGAFTVNSNCGAAKSNTSSCINLYVLRISQPGISIHLDCQVRIVKHFVSRLWIPCLFTMHPQVCNPVNLGTQTFRQPWIGSGKPCGGRVALEPSLDRWTIIGDAVQGTWRKRKRQGRWDSGSHCW